MTTLKTKFHTFMDAQTKEKRPHNSRFAQWRSTGFIEKISAKKQ